MGTLKNLLVAGLLMLGSRSVFAENAHQRVVAEADALVTVNFVLEVKMQGASSDREIDGEITCLTIDADGLVLCSNTELGGYIGLMSRMAGRAGFSASATPREIDVLIGEATEGLPATLLVRDSDRDLAWLQIEGEIPESLSYLDLENGAELTVGDTFYRLRLMDKFFGRAPLVEEGKVAAVTNEPRRLLVPSPSTTAGSGLPVFTDDGRLVGVTVVQLPGAEYAASFSQSSLGFLGSSAKLQDMVGGLILPVADVVKATRLAREIAAEDDESEE